MILAIKTDSMTAELLLIDTAGKEIANDKWEAGRSLAKDLLKHIDELIAAHGEWKDLQGIIVFRGPGSFTSLRIGITTANTISYAQILPIVGTQYDRWIDDGLIRLRANETDTMVLPEYGSDPHITPQKK